ncbi:MAG: YdeI/OmpD-associated family protein [Planctomycetaceae bacterium]
MKRYQSVDEYIAGETQWQKELMQLRKILNGTELEETLKWGAPCYTWRGKNLVGIGSFKSYCGLWFFQGALLSDPDGVLITSDDNPAKAMRQWRFQSAKDIRSRSIRAYVREAVALQEKGQEIKPNRNKSIEIPRELKAALSADRRAAAAFENLTKGRQREYADYIAGAKRQETKTQRLAKIVPLILAGTGLNDKYRNC